MMDDPTPRKTDNGDKSYECPPNGHRNGQRTGPTTLSIDIGTSLILHAEGLEAPVKSTFVGFKGTDYIVVTPPAAHHANVDFSIHAGQPMTAQYLHENAHLAFSTRFLRMVSDPVRLLVLEYPRQIEKMEHRTDKRVHCFIAARVGFISDPRDKMAHGVVRNISKTGCCISLQQPEKESFQEGDNIILRCHFPGIVGEQEGVGKIVDTRGSQGERTLGILFSERLWWIPPYEL